MILAIDTTGPWVAVAAGPRQGTNVCDNRIPAALNHNEELARLVRRILDRNASVKPEFIAVDVGPGSFTGTRVGVSFAVGLAQGWGIPVFRASVFQVAATCAPQGASRVAVALPLVRGVWCRAVLDHTPEGWVESCLTEIAQADARAGAEQMPLIVPWGEVPDAIKPEAEWNPARALWTLAVASTNRDLVEPSQVGVRYVGASQAERNFHARRGET